MRFSSLTDRIQNDGAGAWAVHTEACVALGRGEDVIVLSVGDPDFDTPQPVIDRAITALTNGDTHYPEIPGRPALRAAIADHFAARSGVATTADCVVVCAGTQNALLAAALCVLDVGDEVIALDPMYVTYESTLRMSGAALVTVAQPASNRFRPDVDAIGRAITPRTRAIVLTTPNNPTGVVMTADELTGIAALAREHDLWVIVDEVYADLIFEGTHTHMASLPEMAERTITVSSVSKSHAMTGWRCGWVVGPRELARHVANMQTNVNYGVPGFVQEAVLTALTQCEASIETMRETYRRRRDLAAEILHTVDGLDVLVPEAGMYVLANVAPFTTAMPNFVRSLYDTTGVSVLDAGTFGSSATGWVRISFATDDHGLIEGCTRLTRFLTEHGPD